MSVFVHVTVVPDVTVIGLGLNADAPSVRAPCGMLTVAVIGVVGAVGLLLPHAVATTSPHTTIAI